MKIQKIKSEFKAIAIEALSYSRALFTLKSNLPDNKFIIFSQGRTGSNLVRTLLNSHPQIGCEGEVFLRYYYYFRVLSPKLLLKGRLANCKKNVYGFQLHPPHLISHKINGKEFLSYLHEDNWKIIYLRRRNLLHQKISAIIAVRKDQWHYQADQHSEPVTPLKIYIKGDELIQKLDKVTSNDLMDKELLRNLPHLEVVYEDDLLKSDQHQKTMDKIFTYLNLPSVPVKTSLQKTPYKIREVVENYQELADLLSQTPYAHFLEEE